MGEHELSRDRNLLTGVLAIQLRKITPGQLAEAAAAWAADPSRPLADRLEESGALTHRDRQLICTMVDEAIAVHGGDREEGGNGEETIAHELAPSTRPTTPASAAPSLTREGAEVEVVAETPGRYRGSHEHGRGGIGRILLVYDQYLGRQIALKELLAGVKLGQIRGSELTPVQSSQLTRFLQEARITGQLEHPSIVPVYELGLRTDGHLYYTMKLVRGQSLAQALRKTSSEEERLDLLPHFVDLCQAIAYAHDRGVIHRDIKPGNVMLGEFGETVVIDWGLAKVRGREDIHASQMEKTFHALNLGEESPTARTSYGAALGTPMYMPPEQAKGELDRIDERSDIYSLGVVLYELLTGQPPFRGRSSAEVLSRVISQEPPAIAQLAPDTPPELAAICERAMAREPQHRYPSAKELAEEVQRFLSGALVEAYRYRFAEHLRRHLRKHRVAVVTGAAFLAVLMAVLVGFAAWNLRERRHAQREAATARQVADFLVGLFSILEPEEARASTLTVREILDEGARRTSQELAGEPSVQARLMQTIGGLYTDLGLYEAAAPLLEGALQISRQHLDEQSEQIATCQAELGRLYRLQARYAEAEPLLTSAAAVREELLGPDDPTLAVDLSALAGLRRSQSRYADAAALYQRAIEIRERSFGPDHPEVASSLNSYAVLLYDQGKLAQAEKLYQRALAIQELGDDHLALARTLRNLANLYVDQRRYDEAEERYQRALTIMEAALGEHHPQVASVLSSLGNLLTILGQHERAEQLHRRALRIREEALGPDHPRVANSLDQLAILLHSRGELEQAELLFRHSLGIREKAFGPDHPDVATSLNNLATCYLDLQRPADAEPLLERAVRILEQTHGGDHPTVVTMLENLIDVFEQQQQYDRAVEVCQQCLGIRQRLADPDPADLDWTRERCAGLLRVLGRDAEAASLEEPAEQ